MTPAEDARESPQEIAWRIRTEEAEIEGTSIAIVAAIEAERRDADERERRAAAQARREAMEDVDLITLTMVCAQGPEASSVRHGYKLAAEWFHECISALIDAPAEAPDQSVDGTGMVPRADLDKALEALRPFAEAAHEYPADRYPDDATFRIAIAARVTFGHLRRARAVLAELCPNRPQDSPEEGRDHG